MKDSASFLPGAVCHRGSGNNFELDFESSPTDVINSETMELDFATAYRPVKEYQPEYRRSLRVSPLQQPSHPLKGTQQW